MEDGGEAGKKGWEPLEMCEQAAVNPGDGVTQQTGARGGDWCWERKAAVEGRAFSVGLGPPWKKIGRAHV